MSCRNLMNDQFFVFYQRFTTLFLKTFRIHQIGTFYYEADHWLICKYQKWYFSFGNDIKKLKCSILILLKINQCTITSYGFDFVKKKLKIYLLGRS